ncbi:hypothetical protein B0A79_22640 [Flavobacterium piscis]|uniref:GmrSD restriction endonucleases N-terminal domain-containing protein n=1 Tax=Flavobacterium piscis TaxID=1114874 RepID=A0ABX2XFM3_9FLAO|nr:DUF262 domain-containing protein [Flavobacterium piscis]OCB71195.1 hypothetical protein FLP_16925 [Flavobacterium piscis]OXE96633.1 hypothetical protein B0A79_22640 [Flavobacterium piscis]
MNNNTLKLKSIFELLNEQFYIPSYQRGYRWTDIQVKALLADIWDFRNKDPKKEEFYCLQPVVVTKPDNSSAIAWELIDGQQRLTTIYIILSFFNKRFSEEFRNPVFSLEYQTRTDSKKYLADINDAEKNDNIDYYFIHEAYTAIREWFKGKQNFINDFESILLNNTKVIWYEVNDDSTDSIDIFTRINIGKIPLTNAELVKALFLQKDNFQDKATLKQLQIASEWDAMEKKLQNDSFWHFIYSTKNNMQYENRIEYIFDLIHEKKKENEDHFTFNKFQDEFTDDKIRNNGILDVDGLWLKVKKYFLTIEEWYSERDLYHLIGFLIEYKADINELKKTSDKLSKTVFKEHLKTEIKDRLSTIQIESLEYGQNPYEIRMILLLFNIQTILATKEADMRFPFDKYKSDNWDIEHINSQSDKTISPKDRKSWAIDILEFYTGLYGYASDVFNERGISQINAQKEKIEILKDITKTIANKLVTILESEHVNDELFQEVYEEVLELYIEKENSQIDNISNLALLDDVTNRSYGNAMFFIKRKRIIENDKNGIFVPICTKNVFLKYYTRHSDNNMYWNQKDAIDYLETMKEILGDYLTVKE